MAIPNPLAALNMISPSLIGYTGGYGKAMQALGGSMDSIGQTKLDLAKQIKDNEYKNAQLTLLQNADVRAGDAVTYQKQKDDAASAKLISDAKKEQDKNINTLSMVSQMRGYPLGDVPQQAWGNSDVKLILDQMTDSEKAKVDWATLENNMNIAKVKEQFQPVSDGTVLVNGFTGKPIYNNPKTFAPKGSGGGDGEGGDGSGGGTGKPGSFPKVTNDDGTKKVMSNLLSKEAAIAKANRGTHTPVDYATAVKNGLVGEGTETYIENGKSYALIHNGLLK